MHYWTEIKKDKSDRKALPRLDEVNFTEVNDLRDNLFIIATGNGGGRFIILTSGQVLNEVCGSSPLGKTVCNVFPEPLNGSVIECCITSIDTHQPMIGTGTLILESDREIMYRMIVLPLSEDGKSVDHLVGAISFRFKD